MKHRRTVLDTAVSIAVLVAAVAVVGRVFWGWGLPTPPPAPYAVGQSFERLNGLELRSDVTFVLFVQTTCRFCSASMPFYGRLVQQVGSANVIAVGPEPDDQIAKYFSDHRIELQRTLQIARGDTKFRSTPTLLAINRQSMIIGRWSGQLSAAEETEVLELAKKYSDGT